MSEYVSLTMACISARPSSMIEQRHYDVTVHMTTSTSSRSHRAACIYTPYTLSDLFTHWPTQLYLSTEET